MVRRARIIAAEVLYFKGLVMLGHDLAANGHSSCESTSKGI